MKTYESFVVSVICNTLGFVFFVIAMSNPDNFSGAPDMGAIVCAGLFSLVGVVALGYTGYNLLKIVEKNWGADK